MLKNDAAKGKSWETTEYKLGKAIIQSRHYGTYAVLAVLGGGGDHCIYGTYVVLSVAERLKNHTIVRFSQLCSKVPPTALLNFACDWLALDRDMTSYIGAS